jgi:hypothetical protein
MSPPGMNEVLEVDLMKKFPPAYPSEREVVEGRPLRVLDVRGFTLAWYLPDAISETVQVNSTAFLFSLWNLPFIHQNRLICALAHLRPYLKANPPRSGGGWRNDTDYFRTPGESEIPAGNVTLTPLWGSAGHEVCFYVFIVVPRRWPPSMMGPHCKHLPP